MSDFFSNLLDKVLGYLAKLGPAVASVGLLIYDYMRRKILRQEIENDEIALELKEEQNKDAVEKANSGKSDSDIVDDAIREGGRIRGNQPGPQ